MLTKNKRLTSLLCALSSCILPTFIQAKPVPDNYVLVAPKCLLQASNIHYQSLSTLDQLSLIKTDEQGFNQLIAAKTKQKTACGGFINVTDTWKTSSTKEAKSFLRKYAQPYPFSTQDTSSYAINYPKEVNQLLTLLNPQTMWGNLTTLSSFHDRYANSDTGVKTAYWIKDQVENMAKINNRDDVTAYFIETGHYYKQPSLIVKIGNSNLPGIVVGGHMDTLHAAFGNMPGADDDGSGSVTVLELARILLSSHMHFKKPIYLIWYSAEEMGLVGSQYVVTEFIKQNIPIEEVIHFDMTGYAPHNDPTMWLMTDYTSKELTNYLATLINTYIKKPINYSACGYACSDHAIWTQHGYKAAIAFESKMGSDNPYIHSSEDTMSALSLDHMTDFAKLAVAFTVELAEPIG